ncbi:MAG: amino acid permease, partial [Pseudomonadota bacterium]
WREASWLVPYLAGLLLLSYLGSFGSGVEVIPLGPDMLAVGLLATVVYLFAVRLSLDKTKFKRYLAEEFLDEIEEYDLPEDAPAEKPDFRF